MTTSLMNPAFPGNFSPASNRYLNVVIGYDDFPDGQRAIKICQQLIDHLGREFHFATSLWKFAALAAPELKRTAGKDATEADMLIISAHGLRDLPREVKNWISLLPGKRRAGARALIALLDDAEGIGAVAAPVHSYLQHLAQKAGIAFFSRTFRLPASCNANPLPAAQELFDEPVIPREWGINE